MSDPKIQTGGISGGFVWRGPLVARFMWAIAFVCIVSVMYINPYDKHAINRALGAIVIFVSLLPLSQWLRQRKARQIPLLAMYFLFYGVCFGVAGFVTPQRPFGGVQADEAMYTVALFATIVLLASTWVGFYLTAKMKFSRAAKLIQNYLVIKNNLAVVIYILTFLLGFVVRLTGFTELSEVVSAMRFFSFIWCMHAAWSGRFSVGLCLWIKFGLLPIEIIFFGGFGDGFLVGLLVYGQIVGIIYAITQNRVPVIAAVLIVTAFGMLTPIKGAIREVTWGSTIELNPVESLVQTVQVAFNVYGKATYGLSFRDGFDEAYSRINHLHTAAAVINDTPSVSPFIYGETLLPLITKWIPRLVWSDKPREDIGNRWAKRYNYIGNEDHVTSYNLPWLAEMYMNFGWFGVGLISLMIGALMGSIQSIIITPAVSSAGIAFAMLISSVFFFPESNISLQVGKLVTFFFAACLVVLLIRIIKNRTS